MPPIIAIKKIQNKRKIKLKLSLKLDKLIEIAKKHSAPIAVHKIGEKIFSKIPRFVGELPFVLAIFLSAISLKGTRIHQACANCQITKMNISPSKKPLHVSTINLIVSGCPKKLEKLTKVTKEGLNLKDLLRKTLHNLKLLRAARHKYPKEQPYPKIKISDEANSILYS